MTSSKPLYLTVTFDDSFVVLITEMAANGVHKDRQMESIQICYESLTTINKMT